MKATCQSSGSCLIAMKLCLAVVVCVSIVGYQSTDAAVCTTTNMCMATLFTTTSCNPNTMTCGCMTGYMPIPTGCASKLAQPMVLKDTMRSNEFIMSMTTSITLSCFTMEMGVTYQWYKNAAVIAGATMAQYVVTGSAMAGMYTCTVTDGMETSDPSPALELKQISTAGPSTPPTLSPLPMYAAPGANITGLCMNIPFGATFKYQVGSGTPTTMVMQNSANGNISCVLDNVSGFTQNIMSSVMIWTTMDATNIMSVSIYPQGPMTYQTGTPVRLTCMTTPMEQYLLVGANKITYTFQDSLNPSAAATVVGNMYTVPGIAGIHMITCSAAYNNNATVNSQSYTVTFSDNYIPTPALTTNANGTVATTGARLVLTCGADLSGQNVTYTWSKDGSQIPRQRDRIIQYGNFQITDAGTFYCMARKDNYQANSNQIMIMSAAHGIHVLGSTLLLVLVALTSSKIF